MRQILFKGKQSHNGLYIYGSLSVDYIQRTFITYWVEQIIKGFTENICITSEVVPESVGQYIGVKGYVGEYEKRHKNEVKLFEGDIVEAMSEGSKGTFVITYRTESSPMWLLYPNWQERKHWNIHGSDLGRDKGDYFDSLKVIGNIHENPELLTQHKN